MNRGVMETEPSDNTSESGWWWDVPPDALFRVTLWPTEDGGLTKALFGSFVGFPLHVDDGHPHLNDCRLLLGDLRLEPGSVADVPAVYLSPEEAQSRFPVGTVVKLWAGRFVGEAVVLKTSTPEIPVPTLRQTNGTRGHDS
jgi:hypothetical protein